MVYYRTGGLLAHRQQQLWLEWRLWGLNPSGYHVTNVLLHWIACLLIWKLLRTLAVPGDFFAALLFAVHPVNVESVAWIAQRKGLLAMVFFLLSILWFLRASDAHTDDPIHDDADSVSRRALLWNGLSLLAFVLAMLSKGSVAILPLVLLLIVWWQQGSISKADLLRTVPFFIVSVVLTVVNIWFQNHGADIVVRDVGFIDRILGASAAVWFYLSKALVPLYLVFIYPQWNIQSTNLWWWLPLAAAITFTLAMLWWQRSRATWIRPLLVAWLFLCIALLPVMGFSDVGFMRYSLVADHYQYIAIVAAAAAVAAGFYTGANARTARCAPHGTLWRLRWLLGCAT